MLEYMCAREIVLPSLTLSFVAPSVAGRIITHRCTPIALRLPSSCHLPCLIRTPCTYPQGNVTDRIERNAEERVRRKSFLWNCHLCCAVLPSDLPLNQCMDCPVRFVLPFAVGECVHCAGRRAGKATGAAGSTSGSQTAKKGAIFADYESCGRHSQAGIASAGRCSARQVVRWRRMVMRLLCLATGGIRVYGFGSQR